MANRDDIEVDAMLDTNVLILACREPRKKDTEDAKRACHAARTLLVGFPEIHVSAIAWTEFLRYLRSDEATFLSRVKPRFRVNHFDGAMAERAAEMLKARGQQAVCPRCLNSAASHACATCGAKVAGHPRVADAMIAATAEVLGRPLP